MTNNIIPAMFAGDDDKQRDIRKKFDLTNKDRVILGLRKNIDVLNSKLNAFTYQNIKLNLSTTSTFSVSKSALCILVRHEHQSLSSPSGVPQLQWMSFVDWVPSQAALEVTL